MYITKQNVSLSSILVLYIIYIYILCCPIQMLSHFFFVHHCLQNLNLVNKAIVYKTYLVRFRKGLMMLCSKWDVSSSLCDHHLCEPTPLHPTTQHCLAFGNCTTSCGGEHRVFSECITREKKKKKSWLVVLKLHSHLGTITLPHPLLP